MRSLTFSPDGYKMFVGDAKNDKVNQYSLASPFDLSTTPDFDGNFAFTNSETAVSLFVKAKLPSKSGVVDKSKGLANEYWLTLSFLASPTNIL